MVLMCVTFLLLWEFGALPYAMNRFVWSRSSSYLSACCLADSWLLAAKAVNPTEEERIVT